MVNMNTKVISRLYAYTSASPTCILKRRNVGNHGHASLEPYMVSSQN